MQFFLNNCGQRDLVKLYGPKAFYDLRRNGRHATLLRHIKPGDECVVAVYARGDRSRVIFNWFGFSYEDELRGENGTKFRVFFGEYLRSKELDKAKAAETDPYPYLL